MDLIEKNNHNNESSEKYFHQLTTLGNSKKNTEDTLSFLVEYEVMNSTLSQFIWFEWGRNIFSKWIVKKTYRKYNNWLKKDEGYNFIQKHAK